MGSCSCCLNGIVRGHTLHLRRRDRTMYCSASDASATSMCRSAPAVNRPGWPCVKLLVCAGDVEPAYQSDGQTSPSASSSASVPINTETDLARIQSLIDNADRAGESDVQFDDHAWQEKAGEDGEFEPEDEGLHLCWSEDYRLGYGKSRPDVSWTPTCRKNRASGTGEVLGTPPLPIDKNMFDSARKKGCEEEGCSGLRQYLREVPTPLSKSPQAPAGDLGNFLKVTAKTPRTTESTRSLGCFAGCCSATFHDSYDAEMRSRGKDETAWVPRGQRLDIVWRVVAKSAWIRKGLEVDSDRMFPLAEGDEVMATAVVGAELRVVSPANGWVSLVSDAGEPALLMARHKMEYGEQYPEADVGGTFLAAMLRDDVSTAVIVAADLVRSNTAERRHAIAASHMVARGCKAWGPICELLDNHLWGMPEGPNAYFIQHAILHGNVPTIRSLLDPGLEHKLLASLSTLPSRHIAMAEELFALACSRSAAAVGTRRLPCTCDDPDCAKCSCHVWDQLLRWTSARSWGRPETERRLHALSFPECLTLILNIPESQQVSGVYEYVGEREWRPAYQLKTAASHARTRLRSRESGHSSHVDGSMDCIGSYVIQWHPSGQWCLRDEISKEPILLADGGWIPPLEGWRLHRKRSTEGTETPYLYGIEDRFVFEHQICTACRRGDIDVIAQLVVGVPPLVQQLVFDLEDQLRCEREEARVSRWGSILQCCGVAQQRIAELTEERRYLKFPRLTARSAWQMLALGRLRILEARAAAFGQFRASEEATACSAPVLRDCILFDNNGKACLSQGDVQQLREGLAHCIGRKIHGASFEGELVPISAMLDILSQDLWSAYDNNADDSLREVFNALDTHQSGFLSIPDIKHGMTLAYESLLKYGLGELCIVFTDAEVLDMIEEADMHGNGRVNYLEFARIVWATTIKDIRRI